MPYNGILLSENIHNLISHEKRYRYILHSPLESLETAEMENILHTRWATPVEKPEESSLVLIHRLYQPCLNYIPMLTEHKRRNADILLFGSYLGFETNDNSLEAVFGSGISKIFPNAGRICFTLDHLFENPRHTDAIFSYSVCSPNM